MTFPTQNENKILCKKHPSNLYKIIMCVCGGGGVMNIYL